MKKRNLELPSSKTLGSKRIKFNPECDPCLKCKKNMCEGAEMNKIKSIENIPPSLWEKSRRGKNEIMCSRNKK